MAHFELLFPNKYFKSAALRGAPDVVLTIAGIEGGHELTMAGGKKDFKPVLRFTETAAREANAPDGHKGAYLLVLNKTNARTIAKLYGADADDWIGKRIALYMIEDTGNGKPGIRVRPSKPKAGAASEPEHDPETGEIQED